MKYKIVLINFPFDDFSGSKLRPALALSNIISQYNHIILAPITSKLENAAEETDLIIRDDVIDFDKSGLKVSSVIKLHRLITVSDVIIEKIIGCLPVQLENIENEKVRQIFSLPD